MNKYFQEAAERFSDTSWQIHRQWQTDAKKAFPTVPLATDVNKSAGDVVDGSKASPCSVNGHANGIPVAVGPEKPQEITKVEIETIQTTYETIPEARRIEVVLVRLEWKIFVNNHGCESDDTINKCYLLALCE